MPALLAYRNTGLCGAPQGQVGGFVPQQMPVNLPVLPVAPNGIPVVGGPQASMQVGGPVPVFGGPGQSTTGLGTPYTYALDQYGNLVAIPPQFVQQVPRFAFGT